MSPKQEISYEERRRRGAEVEALLANDPQAAPAPQDWKKHSLPSLVSAIEIKRAGPEKHGLD